MASPNRKTRPDSGTGDTVTPTPRDESLLRTLLFKVRLLSFEQIVHGWWSDGPRRHEAAERRLNVLTEALLLDEREIMAEPMLDLVAPVSVWNPGEPEPNADMIAWRLQSRWQDSPSSTRICVATQLAAGLYGGVVGHIPTLGQETHDLHVSVLYLHFCATRPADADAWVGEEILRPYRTGEKLPDAVLVTPERQIRRVIEFGGKYDARRVTDFHRDCCSRHLPYELW